MAGGHDQLWKDLIQAFPVDFLRLVDQDLAERLDLSSLKLGPVEEFLDQPKGAERCLDLVGGAKTWEGDELVVHVEIELRYRAQMPGRLSVYNRLLTLRRRLPVHTVVLYLRGGPPGEEASRLAEVSCDREVWVFSYRSFGLSGSAAHPLLDRPEPLAWAFAALARAERGGRRALRRACLTRIAAAEGLSDDDRFRLFNCVSTYLELDGGAAEEYEALRARFMKPGVEMKPVTWEEKVEARGIKRGREEGKEEGMRELLLRQIRTRFPSLTGQTIERIEAIRSPEELGSLAERLLTARSIEELGLA